MADRTLDCARCGATFTTTHSHQKHCTRKCGKRAAYHYTPRRYTGTCRWCSATFQSSTKAQRACSTSCNERWQAVARREQNLARVQAWQDANPERFARRMAEARARRRALIASAPTRVVTDRDLRRMRERQQGCCAYCSESKPLTLEHIVPLVRGGAHAVGNLCWVCKSCNCSKGRKLLAEWRAYRSRVSATGTIYLSR